MHEMSIAGGILQVVEDTAVREGFQRVSHLRLEIGALSGVEIESLRFACSASFAGTCLDKAEIEIITPAAQAWCMNCSKTVEIQDRLDACPECAGHRLQATSGTELKIIDMIVLD